MNPNTCKHYTGSFNTTCAIGIKYDDVTTDPGKKRGSGLRIACHHRRPCDLTPAQERHYLTRGTCEHYEEPTQSELEEDEQSIKQAVARMKLTCSIVSEIKRKYEGVDWQGTRPCPICDGTLSLSHAAYNGHVWGHCATDSCVNWME